MSSTLSDLANFRNCRSKRISCYDRTGGNDDYIKIGAGETAVIAEIKGAGIIRHIWFTYTSEDKMFGRNVILRMYWDDETEPSVLSPIGDFFGQGWGENYEYAALPLSAAPEGGKALISYFSMPFSKGARITVENDSNQPVIAFYYYIDYEEHASISEDTGRFHAWWNREITKPALDIENEWGLLGEPAKNASVDENYSFADIEGKGHFVGLNYYVQNPGPMWYGEGDDMWLIDGEGWPGSLHGTGTEDFFNTSWAPNKVYIHPYFGCAKAPVGRGGWMGKTHNYRFFIEDPICFSKSLKATIEHGHANGLTLDIATVAYWYQAEPHKVFLPVPCKEKRQNMPEIQVADIHQWREAWRQSRGGGLLWGNEVDKIPGDE